jgi:hypothetical protein
LGTFAGTVAIHAIVVDAAYRQQAFVQLLYGMAHGVIPHLSPSGHLSGTESAEEQRS